MSQNEERGPWNAELLANHVDRLGRSWRRSDGVFATAYRGDACVDATPLVADLGDTVPFLVRFGLVDAALEQAQLSRRHLWHGLFCWQGRVRLFDNHDFLLGLLDLFDATGQPWLLDLIHEGIDTLERHFEEKGLLIDELIGGRRSGLASASPFNGGYVELCVDLHALTGEQRMLDRALRWARAWTETGFFVRHGLFAHFNLPRAPVVGVVRSWVSRVGPIRLFKDNTNLVWSLAVLHRATGEPWLRSAVIHFIDGFERLLWNQGRVRQFLGLGQSGFDLKAATASIDLLCDLSYMGFVPERTLCLAQSIADDCGLVRWTNGLMPQTERAGRDHLDCMTDLGIALWKLSELTGDASVRREVWRGWRAMLAAHETPHGFVTAVGPDGEVADDRVIVKYQGLLLKSALLDSLDTTIYGDQTLWSLLRDR